MAIDKQKWKFCLSKQKRIIEETIKKEKKNAMQLISEIKGTMKILCLSLNAKEISKKGIKKTPQCNLSQKLLIVNVVIYTCLRERYRLAETWSWRNRNRASSSSRGLCRRERKRCSRTPRKPRRGGVPGRLGGGLRRKSMPERRRPSREPPLVNWKTTERW